MSEKDDEYYKESPLLTKPWTESHMRAWGKHILNLGANKKKFTKKINSINESEIQDLDEYEIEPYVGTRAIELVCLYFSYKVEAVIKRAFLHMAMDGRKTLREDDIFRSLMRMDMEIDYDVTIGSPLERDFKKISKKFNNDEE